MPRMPRAGALPPRRALPRQLAHGAIRTGMTSLTPTAPPPDAERRPFAAAA
jgi:hypothetical protein